MATQIEIQFCCWHIASFRCYAQFVRYLPIADLTSGPVNL
jgi:hypothetical protein